MTADKFDKLGPLYADIGGEISEIVGGSPAGTVLYTEAGEGWIGAGVFKDEGESVRYFDPSSELCDLLLEAWNTEDPGKRWVQVTSENTVEVEGSDRPAMVAESIGRTYF